MEGQVREAGKRSGHRCSLLLDAKPPDQCSARLCGKCAALKEQRRFIMKLLVNENNKMYLITKSNIVEVKSLHT